MKQAHIVILKAFDEIPFNIGRKTLVDFIKGNPNVTIEKNNLDELNSYGALYMLDLGDIYRLIDILVENKLIENKIVGSGFQVLSITPQGRKEIFEKNFNFKFKQTNELNIDIDFEISKVTDSDRRLFEQFSFFLEKFNDEQKKAIISSSKSILTIAGPGSGKTSVLTKRIEFLKKFRGVKEENILAITFTKKAKEEMQSRLNELGILNVKVATFNSYCEGILRRYSDKIYETEVKVASYGDKISAVRKIMDEKGISLDSIADEYFNKRQLREKSIDELFFIFVNDIFSIIDFYKNREEDIKAFYELEKNSLKKNIAKLMYEISINVSKLIKIRNLRDFTDQIIDVLNFFRNNKDEIFKFEHILVDEFQDLNLIQFELLKIMNPINLFAVGDPRQAIYGWRGSDTKYIVDFQREFKGAEIISLKKNYRSTPEIVGVFNSLLKDSNFEYLEASRNDFEEKNIFLFEQENEKLERIFVTQAIKNSKNPKNEIFVLARTNRILENYADSFREQGIDFIIKSEETYRGSDSVDELAPGAQPGIGQVVLATIHSIKGMEAKEVYVVSCNSLSFPNKVVDNFVLALVKKSDIYDKDEEELRLFYVALSRAKDKLVLTYTGNLSKFVNDEMLSYFSSKVKNKSLVSFTSSKYLEKSTNVVLKNLLKDWRAKKANQTGLPTYMVISNNAIDDICLKLPRTKLDLQAINGLGDVKIAKYGDEILRLVNG